MNSTEDVLESIVIGMVVATFLLNTGRSLRTIELCEECLTLLNIKEIKEQFFKLLSTGIYQTKLHAYCLIPDYTTAIQYGRELLMRFHEWGDEAIKGKFTIALANINERQYKYAEAKELYGKAINITVQNGDRRGQAYACKRFGIMSYYLGEYVKAHEYIEKALAIRMEIGDREGEATDCGNLGTVFSSLGEYAKAQEYIEKALAIRMDIGDRQGEATDYENLGTVVSSLGKYAKAQEYIEKALAIKMEIGDKNGQAACYVKLGTVFKTRGEYAKAQEHIEKALAIRMEIGDRKGQAAVV